LIKDFLDIRQHVRLRPAFNNQIVDVNVQVSAYLVLKGPVHQTLVCGPDILQFEGHISVAKDTNVSVECGIVFIMLGHLDLVVSLVSIHKALKLAGSQLVYFYVNCQKGVAILGAGVVEIFDIDAHQPASVNFPDTHRIGDPGLVLNLPKDASMLQLLDLISYYFASS
jgi:hypothetical protein